MGPAQPPADLGLTRTSDVMKLSAKLFLLSADNKLYALAGAAFMRMPRREDVARVPDFAGQRVRQASIVLEAPDGVPLRIVHHTFSVLEIDANGLVSADELTQLNVCCREVRPCIRRRVKSGANVRSLRIRSLNGENRYTACDHVARRPIRAVARRLRLP